MQIRFGAFTFDQEQRLLLHGTEPVHLTPKAMRLLEVLVENRPRAMSKKELLDLVWPDVVVEEGNLKSVVSEIRRALGDEGRDSTFVRTVFGHGYAFAGDATTDVPNLPLTLRSAIYILHGDLRFMLTEGENIMGRSPECAVFIDEISVSRQHARITVSGKAAVLEDLGSRNGTFHNGSRIEGPLELHDGTMFQLGDALLTYRFSDLDMETPMLGS
jgi:DNA-binding winged helix-turn-helix (wHTH) protein